MVIYFDTLITISSPTTFSSAQFNSTFNSTLDARGYLAWTSLGIILFLRSLHSKFNSGFSFFDKNYIQSSILDFIGYYLLSSIIIFKVQLGIIYFLRSL